MFLHLGADTVIPIKKIISITDLKASRSGINEEFIKTMREENLINDVSEGNAKSFVVTDRIVYLSAISASTLKRDHNFLPKMMIINRLVNF